MTGKRQYSYALLAGAVGAVVVLFAVREQWAQAVFTPPKPLTSEVVNVSGTDLVPVAGGLGLAALAALVGVIATRGWVRRAVRRRCWRCSGAGAGAAVLDPGQRPDRAVGGGGQGRLAGFGRPLRCRRVHHRRVLGRQCARRHRLLRARDHDRRPVAGSGDLRRAAHLRGRGGHGAARAGLAGDVRSLRRPSRSRSAWCRAGRGFGGGPRPARRGRRLDVGIPQRRRRPHRGLHPGRPRRRRFCACHASSQLTLNR